MILQLIERYYTIYWVILIGFATLKIIFSVGVEGRIHGMVDLFINLLKWYGAIERSLADSDEIKSRMQIQNLITVGMIASLLVVIAVSMLRSYL